MKVLVRYEYQYKQANDPVKYFDHDTVMLDGKRLTANTLIEAFRDFAVTKRAKLLSDSTQEDNGSVLLDRDFRNKSKYLVKATILWFVPEFPKSFFRNRLQK